MVVILPQLYIIANCVSKTISLLLKLWDIAQYPSQDGCMSETDAALGHHISEVAIAELVSDVPADAENDY
jgi:hypothetical protein